MKKNSIVTIQFNSNSRGKIKKGPSVSDLVDTLPRARPNLATRKAIDDLTKDRNVKIFENIDDLFAELES